ncbi:MAG: imidazoleglycerol-phosphate dehydratase HisB [Desulfovermiculus sp.]|nr:imidazoleglycerol-phosphate dehydratase HisB [Desulfovermiculus sp.]
MPQMTAQLERTTKETSIQIDLSMPGEGNIQVQTGMGFADHMLTLLAFWAGMDLSLTAQGDLEVDAHHSLEDIGLCVGQALHDAGGDKKGLARVGWARVPMDEALADVVLDFSGRPYLVYNDEILPAILFGQEKDVWREFFKSLAFRAGMNVHIRYAYGCNGHHLLESAFKGFGLCLRQALRREHATIFSTKGSLD